MKKIILMLVVVFVLAGSGLAQFNIAEADTISASDSIATYDLRHLKLAAIIMDTAMTATTFTIYTSDENVDTTYKAVQYDGSDITLTVTADKQCGLKPVAINQLMRYVKIVGDASEAIKRNIKWVTTSF